MIELGKLSFAIRKRLIKMIAGRFFVTKRNGFLYLIDIYDHVSRKIEAEGVYEKAQVEFLLSRAQNAECDCFLDIGANLGQYSICFSEIEDIEIFAFEPDIRVRHHLFANIFLNNLDDRIEVSPIALSDSTGFASFARHGDQNRGRSKISEQGSHKVRTQRLDDLLEWTEKKIAIKVDIEGHEQAFLAGAGKFLQNNQCLIQIELLADVEKVSEIFEGLGYSHLSTIGNDSYFSNFGDLV